MRSCATALLVATATLVTAGDWHVVDKEVFEQSWPRISADSDAEADFWEITIEDRSHGRTQQVVVSHYLRIRIFTERGVRRFATVEIPQLENERLTGLAARTIKRNGRVVVPDTSGVFERDVAKSRSFRMSSTSFVMPELEPGDMIEYRWQEIRNSESAHEMRVELQRDLPVRRVSCFVKPSPPSAGDVLRAKLFNAGSAAFRPSAERPGFFEAHLRDVAAFRREPHAPPENYTRAWALLFYDEPGERNLEQYWKSAGREAHQAVSAELKADKALDKAAKEIVREIEGDAKKIAAIERFIRFSICNVDRESGAVTAEARSKFRANQHPRDTLRKKMGTSSDTLMLFVSLARSAGFEAYTARVPDRSDAPFDPNLPTMHFLGGTSAAVKVDGEWRFFDPSTPYLETGMLRWQEQGQWALIAHPDGGFFVKTPVAPAAASLKKRKGDFRLLEDGTLEGRVELEYTGHAGSEQKESLEGMSPGERVEDWTRSTLERFHSAFVAEMKIEGADSELCPLRVSYRVSIPGYGKRTGTRLMIPAAVFQRNVEPLLSSGPRTSPLFFRYAWKELDEVRVELPQGWRLLPFQAVGEAPTHIAEAARYQTSAGSAEGALLFRRVFEWGDTLSFDRSEADALALTFERVHETDNQLVVAERSK